MGQEPDCTVASALGSVDNPDSRLYISGESKIFTRRPELQDDLQSDFLDSIAPGKRVFTQLFFGYAGMGSDIHSAVGFNMFRMIAGRKKWFLIPQTQTPYLMASLNQNGFSSHTLTFVGKGKSNPSPWFKKLERYTVTLEPGDLLINTAWYWHGIINEADGPNDLVIGCPTRYAIPYAWPAFKSNWLLTSIALATIQYNYNGITQFTSKQDNLQDGIELARKRRAAQTNVLEIKM